MKVCHITSAHQRYDVRIFEKECVSLAKRGYNTFLVVNDNNANEICKGVNIVSTNFSPQNRAERFLFSTRKVLKKAIEINADIYHLHDPELLSISLKLKGMGKKVIFDAHEDTELQIYDKGWIPKAIRGAVARGYARYFRSRIGKLDGIITVTPAFIEKFKKYNKCCVLVTNYPIIDESQDAFVTHNHKHKEKYIFFAGGISEQWNHEIVARAADECGVKYVFAGRGDDEYLKKITGMPNTEYLGIIPHDKVNEYYADAIAGMAILTCTQVGDEGTLGNTKLFEVMQASKPVICTNFKLWKDIIDKYNCGLSINPLCYEELVEAIRFIKNNETKAYELGRNGRVAIEEEYNWACQEKNLVKIYDEIME